MICEIQLSRVCKNLINTLERENIIYDFNGVIGVQIAVTDKVTGYLDRVLNVINSKEFKEYYNRCKNFPIVDIGISKPESIFKILEAIPVNDSFKNQIDWDSIEADTIDSHTEKNVSPIAQSSRLLNESFELTSTFGTVNSKVISNILDTSLSTDKIHRAVLDNFDGVRFRRQKGGFVYTLRPINVGDLNG